MSRWGVAPKKEMQSRESDQFFINQKQALEEDMLQSHCAAQFLHYSLGCETCDDTHQWWPLPKAALRTMYASALTFGVATLHWWRRCGWTRLPPGPGLMRLMTPDATTRSARFRESSACKICKERSPWSVTVACRFRSFCCSGFAYWMFGSVREILLICITDLFREIRTVCRCTADSFWEKMLRKRRKKRRRTEPPNCL